MVVRLLLCLVYMDLVVLSCWLHRLSLELERSGCAGARHVFLQSHRRVGWEKLLALIGLCRMAVPFLLHIAVDSLDSTAEGSSLDASSMVHQHIYWHQDLDVPSVSQRSVETRSCSPRLVDLSVPPFLSGSNLQHLQPCYSRHRCVNKRRRRICRRRRKR